MFKRTALYGLAVALFLIFASNSALAKQFSLLLHYENGTVSTIENGLKILDGYARVASRPEPAANKRIYRCDLIDARGVVLKSVYAKIPRTLYGDWLDEKGNMAGSATVMDQADFLVNIPYADNAALIKITSSPSAVKLPGDVRLEAGSTEELTISTGSFAVDHSKSGSRVDSASIEALNGITFIVLAEGYTDEAKFNSDVLRIFGQEGTANDGVFFNYSFFGTNKGRFNVKKVFKLSAQTGADHAGGCDDPSLVNTYFDASFCWDGETSRLLAANEAKALAAATEAYPSFNSDRDIIFVMVNSTTYGGSGGGIATFSLHEASTEIALHEAGHVLGGLADEYTTPYPGYPEGDPEPNVTYSLSRSTSGICTPSGTSVYISCFAKRYWNSLIAADTPLPTSSDYCIDCIGKFEGARYKTTGIYRPKYTCKMRSLNQPFCEVCNKALEMNVFGYIAVTLPAGGDDWVINAPKTIQWSSWGFPGNVTIKLVKPKDCSEELLDIPGGTNTVNDGSHPWTVAGDVLDNYKIRISSVYDPSISGDSQPFDIVTTTTTSIRPTTSTTTSIRPSTTTTRPTTTTTRPTTTTTRPTTTTTRPTTTTTTSCPDTCASKGYTCGTWSFCGTSVNCGTCSDTNCSDGSCQGCIQGKCYTCTDTDKGQYPNTLGTVSGYDAGKGYHNVQDSCYNNGPQVLENYCNNGVFGNTIMSCSSGAKCYNGACEQRCAYKTSATAATTYACHGSHSWGHKSTCTDLYWYLYECVDGVWNAERIDGSYNGTTSTLLTCAPCLGCTSCP